jgi:hypothetical protein
VSQSQAIEALTLPRLLHGHPKRPLELPGHLQPPVADKSARVDTGVINEDFGGDDDINNGNGNVAHDPKWKLH